MAPNVVGGASVRQSDQYTTVLIFKAGLHATICWPALAQANSDAVLRQTDFLALLEL